jgi:hypothetical protein
MRFAPNTDIIQDFLRSRLGKRPADYLTESKSDDRRSHHGRLCFATSSSFGPEKHWDTVEKKVLVHVRPLFTKNASTAYLELRDRYEAQGCRFVFSFDHSSFGRNGRSVNVFSRRWSPFYVRSNWTTTTPSVLAAVDSFGGSVSLVEKAGTTASATCSNYTRLFPDIWQRPSVGERGISPFP